MKKQKRLTAAQKEAAEIAAIRARIEDMARGAYGGSRVEDDPDCGIFVWQTLPAEAVGRWIDAIRLTFHPSEVELHDWSVNFGPYDLHKFESLDSAAKYLHGLGVRA